MLYRFALAPLLALALAACAPSRTAADGEAASRTVCPNPPDAVAAADAFARAFFSEPRYAYERGQLNVESVPAEEVRRLTDDETSDRRACRGLEGHFYAIPATTAGPPGSMNFTYAPANLDLLRVRGLRAVFYEAGPVYLIAWSTGGSAEVMWQAEIRDRRYQRTLRRTNIDAFIEATRVRHS